VRQTEEFVCEGEAQEGRVDGLGMGEELIVQGRIGRGVGGGLVVVGLVERVALEESAV
jgi:hypothetical protein